MEYSRLHHKSYGAVQSQTIINRNPRGLRIIKNLVVLCAGTALLFTGYGSLSTLQSTMNREDGVGVWSQATLYACFCISAIFLPKLFITKFGSKWTSIFAMFGYAPYIASNYYPHWGLMISTSILVGIAGPLLWASHSVYLNDISVMYSEYISSNVKESTIVSNLIEGQQSGNKNTMYYTVPHTDRRTENFEKHYEKLRYEEIKGTSDLQPYKKEIIIKGSIDISKDKAEISATLFYNEIAKPSYINNLNNQHTPQEDVAADLVIELYGSRKKSEACYHPSTSDIFNKNELNESKRLISKGATSVVAATAAKFFGFHAMAHLSSHIFSSLLSYVSLKTDVLGEVFNKTVCTCGADFCNVASECFDNNAGDPSQSIRNTLTTICLSLILTGALVVGIFLDPLENGKKQEPFSFSFLKATYNISKRKELLLLIPLSIETGMAQAFYNGDFNKAFIACAWGTYNVGLVALCYGVMCGISCLLSGWLVKHIGRLPVFILGAALNVAANVYLLMWTPDYSNPRMFFYAAGLWGSHVGIFWPQLRAFYGVLFKADEEAAFSAFHLWSGLGMCLAFGSSEFFCIYHKIYVILAVAVLGFTGYLVVELFYSKNKFTEQSQ